MLYNIDVLALFGNNNLIINPLELVICEDTVKVQSLIEHSDKKEYLWYSFPKNYEPYLTKKLDGFLVGLLILAMKNNEDITVKGTISKKLYFNLTHSFMKIVSCVFPKLKPIKIYAEKLDDGKTEKCEGCVGTGFSGGVDSFCTLHDHLFNETLPDYKITHLVFNNVGSHDEWDTERGRRLFNMRYDLLKGYPQSIGKDFIKIDSNLSDILNWTFFETHLTSNFSAILCLQKLFAKYYYSSSSPYYECIVKAKGEISSTEPMTVHLLSTETFDAFSAGCEYTRVEKTQKMAEVPNANRWLNVCVPSEDGTNCSVCFKCMRTLIALDVLGLINKFGHVFDLKKWQDLKLSYLIRNMNMKGPEYEYIKEIKEYANKTGYNISLKYKLASKLCNSKLISPLIKWNDNTRIGSSALKRIQHLRGQKEKIKC